MTGSSRSGPLPGLHWRMCCRLLVPLLRGSGSGPAEWTGIDPDRFGRFIHQTGMAPVIVRCWQENVPLRAATPVETGARLAAFQIRHRDHQETLLAAWRELLDGWSAAGIAPVCLKGFPLSRLLYGDPLLRSMADLDFLVRREEVPAAAAVLERIGYRSSAWRGMDEAYEAEWRRESAGRFVNVDLHWDLAHAWHFLPASSAGFRERSVWQETAGCRHRAPAPADVAYYQLLQCTKDYDAGNFRAFFEMLLLAGRLNASGDWPAFRHRVEQELGRWPLLAMASFSRLYFPELNPADLFDGNGGWRSRILSRPSLYAGTRQRFWLKDLLLPLVLAPRLSVYLRWLAGRLRFWLQVRLHRIPPVPPGSD